MKKFYEMMMKNHNTFIVDNGDSMAENLGFVDTRSIGT